jgi:hypothetical protein
MSVSPSLARIFPVAPIASGMFHAANGAGFSIRPVWVTRLNYPADDVVGNDDSSTNDETNNPYANAGVLTSRDNPADDITQGLGVNGDVFEKRTHFGEFARVELDGHWYRISAFHDWRQHLLFRKVAGRWANNGSNIAEDNAGF